MKTVKFITTSRSLKMKASFSQRYTQRKKDKHVILEALHVQNVFQDFHRRRN